MVAEALRHPSLTPLTPPILPVLPQVVKLKAFSKFENTTEALQAAASLVDSKLSKGLKKFLKKHAEGDTLAVLDAKLGNVIKEKLGINCLFSSGVMELTRGVRNQLTALVAGLSAADLRPMSLGLSHSLSRYKLKFSPDKVDTMIVQVGGRVLGWADVSLRGLSMSCFGGAMDSWIHGFMD